MNTDAGQNNDLVKFLANDMQDLDTIRHDYEIQAQAFSRRHNLVVTVTLASSVVLVYWGIWWVSIFVFLLGILVILFLKMKKLAVERKISQIDSDIRYKSLEILVNASYKQN